MRLSIIALLTWIGLGASASFAEFSISCLDEGVYYGGAPESAADFKRLRSRGVRHVIDVRSYKRLAGSQERELSHRYGLRYERIPTSFFPTRFGTTERVMQIMNTRPCGPVFVHCNLGKDRTGLLVALYRVRHLGWQPAAAFQEMKRGQFNGLLKDLDRYFWKSVNDRAEPLQKASEKGDDGSFQLHP